MVSCVHIKGETHGSICKDKKRLEVAMARREEATELAGQIEAADTTIALLLSELETLQDSVDALELRIEALET